MKSEIQNIVFPKFRYYESKAYHPNWQELNLEAAKLAAQIARNIEPRKRLAGTFFQKRRFFALLKTLKALLINKRRMAKGNQNFIPIFYIWTMTNQCNFLCSYCSNHRGGKYPELYQQGLTENLSTVQGMKLIKIMKDSSAIYFCGGEPTLRKDLPELLDYSSKLNMFNMINTNGALLDLLVKPQYKKFLNQMDVVIISVDSLNIPQLADIYKVSESTARKVLRNILALRILRASNLARFKLVANTVITRDNIDECFDILNWCNDLGICFSPVSANIDQYPDDELINNPRYRDLVRMILKRSREGYPMIASTKMLARLLYAKGINCYPTVFDHIDYNGELFWPCKAYPNAAMINVLNYPNVDAVHHAAEKIINPINFHGDGGNQCGGHCAWMQDIVTDAYARALILGFFDSGILNEIKGLMG